MTNYLLLLLSANHLQVQHMVKGRVALQLEFSDSPDDRMRFSELLQTVRCPTYLLVDVIEEDFRLETIPYLTGKTQRELLKRKFEQFYRGTPFHQATLLRRQADGRRDVEMLFSALTNPALLAPWLDALSQANTPLVGIYSVPHVSTPLIKHHPSKHLLLITWNRFSGLRETYFNEHHLQISRLTPITPQHNFQTTVASELARTYQYLKSLSLLPVGHVLDVCIVGQRADLIDLQTKLPNSTEMHYEFVELNELAQPFNFAAPLTDSDASQLFLHQLAHTRPNSQYGSGQHTHHYMLWQIRRALFWLAGITLVASALWSAQALIWQNTPDEQAVALLMQHTQQTQRETQLHQMAQQPTDVPPNDLRSAVMSLQQLRHAAQPPEAFLTPLSLVMNRHEHIQLDELAWERQQSSNSPATDHGLPSGQIILMTGHLTNAANNYREVLNDLSAFEQALNQNGYQTRMLSRPLDVSSSSTISNYDPHEKKALTFSLQLVWSTKP
jgi:hypothetical protein